MHATCSSTVVAMNIERKRLLLEELESLEKAICLRFKRNFDLLHAAGIENPDSILEHKKRRPQRQNLLQRHELKFFVDQYLTNVERVSSLLQPALLSEVAELQDPKMKFSWLETRLRAVELTYKPDETASSVGQVYRPFLAASSQSIKLRKGKKLVRSLDFLSTATVHLETTLGNSGSSEAYGSVLDLKLFYDSYKLLLGLNLSYLEYLRLFASPAYVSHQADYVRYQNGLLEYLKSQYRVAYPLKPEPHLSAEVAKPELDLFCVACDKLFSKDSVYQGHLQGKKHQKNVKNMKNIDSKPSKVSLGSQITQYASLLEPILENTIRNLERKAGMSEREKILDAIAADGNESDYTNYSSSENEGDDGDAEDDDDDDLLGKNLPLGTDGTPIPLWLYKLQGLHKQYRCEICGNAVFKGRLQFAKHFGLTKHIHGLLSLGVSELKISLFGGISEISGAKDLWNELKKDNGSDPESKLDDEEVEDDEGNVMSRKDYVELKKQGLL